MTNPTAADRTLDAMRRLVRTFFPALVYLGRYRYTVHSATASTFDGTPVNPDVAPQLPTGVPYALALAGSSCIPVAGTIAHVMFADGDPGQPVCVGFETTGGSTTTAIDAGAINLGAALGTVVRQGDTISIASVPPVAGIITITLGLGVPPVPSKVKA